MKPDRLIVDTQKIAGVPAITVVQEGAESCPVVFYNHGFTSSKEARLSLGYRLASRGFFYISLDAWMHGDRWDQRLEDTLKPTHQGDFPFNCGLDRYYLMFKIVEHTSKDIQAVIEQLAGDPRVDVSRTGVCGESMGGFVTFHSAAFNPYIKAAVSLISFPAFRERLDDILTEASSYPQWAEDLQKGAGKIEEIQAYFSSIDPVEKLADFAPRPLLIIQGDMDTDAPKYLSVKQIQRLLPLYSSHPNRLKLSIHDGIAHRVTSKMEVETTDWFVQYLA